jgi:hypothetical protein
MFLVKKRVDGSIGSGGKAHYWMGQDTACRMFSTREGNRFAKHGVVEHHFGKPICTMCEVVRSRDSS